MPGRSQGRSQRTAATPSSTDRTDRTVSSTFESADVWDGGQVQRTPWFFKKLHKLQETFKFKLFCVSACVSIPNKGQIAVYSVEHAKAHRNGELKGTIKDPCMWVPATTSAPVVAPSSTPSHGGYPGTPTPSAPPPAPAATYAGAVTTTGRPPTPLERALGDAASGYVIAPYACEEVDSELLEFFLSDIDNERLVKIWRKRCTSGSDGSSRGRTFIVEMMKDISNDELSMTGENTIQSRIDLIVRSGLNEPSLQELYYMMDIHEAWTDALPLSTQPNDAKKAHIYQKWVCDLSPSIKVQMQVEMNSIESKALANGKNLRYEDPIGLVTQAATVVLQDEQNEAEIKGIESGRAFFSSKFDARKRPPSRTAPGGQTWAAPTSWQTGMRLCAMCPEGTAESARRHLDKDCSHATPAKLAARAKEIEEKRAKRKAEREKTKSGSANLAGGLALAEAIDGADAEAIKSIFPDDQEGPVILDLSSIMEGANARSLMVKGNAADATTTATATSISTALDQTDRLLASSKIFVVGYSGDDTVDSIDPGIWIGQWSSDVLPAIVKLHLDNQLVLDEPGLKKRTGRVQSLEAAVSRCHKLSITPEYMGVIKLEGLNVGDNIENYLRLASGNASDGEPSLYEETSGEEDDDEPEPEVKATPSEHGPTNEPGTAADDLAVLFDDAPPSQPPSSATKFDNDLGSTAANITYAAPSPKTPLASSPLTMLTQQIEGITVNTHIDVIKDIIRTNNLPVSPSTGGSEARTKFEMINEMRDLIGSTPLPVEALLQRRRRPDPVPPVPMGIAITNTKPTATLVRRSGLPPAAKYLRDVHQYHLYFHDDGSVDGVTYAVQMDRNTGGRELDFDATEQSAKESQAAAHGSAETIVTPHSVAQLVYETIKFIVTTFVTIVRYLVMLMVTLIVSANMWVLFFAAYQPHLAPEFALDFTFCRRVAPAALCRLLAPGDNLTTNSMLDHAGGPAPPHGLTDGTQPSVEPGANDGSQGWPSWSCPSLAPSEALGLLLPSVICLILLLHSAFVTASYTYFASTLSWSRFLGQANGLFRGLGRPQDPPRDVNPRTRSPRRARRPRHDTSSFSSSSRFLSTLGAAPLWLSILFLAVEIGTFVVPSLAALSIEALTIHVTRGAYLVLRSVWLSYAMTPIRVLSRFVFNVVVLAFYLAFRVAVDTTVSRRPYVSADGTWCCPDLRAPRRHPDADLSHCGGVGSSSCLPTPPSVLSASTNPPTTAQHGRALLSRNALKTDDISKYVCWTVIDSGCSWHCHPHVKDLVNCRPCHDTLTGIDGKPQKVICIGDLPALAKDHLGVWRRIIIRNVRCVPTFGETLLSVDQFWQDSRVDIIFNSTLCIVVPGSGEEAPLDLPFTRKELLYKWAIVPTQRHHALSDTKTAGTKSAGIAPSVARAFKATIHRPNSTSFFTALPPGEMLELLHRRLHIGYDTIRRLGTTSSDVPPSIAKAHAPDCESCKTANATRVPHPGKAYAPSHVGRLVHGDLAGPFKRSQHGFTYFLVLVDDHSRFKQVYFLKNKSEALNRIKSFVAKLNAICNVGKPEAERVRIVGQLHLDNAGEFLSKEFTEYLDSESITRTTCPPHVHQLNGVAERAIRSIMDIVRATREASACPISFWPHLVEHAVDVLNRTTGPPHVAHSADGKGIHHQCSLEIVTGQKPKILNIMPIGCRAYAVKPPNAYTKSGFESRAWAGICLGRSTTISGAYNIWLPSLQKLIQTSEVYFDESLYPWRAPGDQRIGLPTPTAAPPTDDFDITAGGGSLAPPPSAPQSHEPPVDASLPESFASATRTARSHAATSMRVLLLFSGSYHRPDGLAQFARKLGLEVELFDNDVDTGGGADADITNDRVYASLRERIVRGHYAVIMAAPPCSTFSISRFFESASSEDGGPPIVRTRSEIEGCSSVPPAHRVEVERANDIVGRMAALLMLAHKAGTQFIVENPADRGDLTKPKLYLHRDHGPLWLMPAMQHLADKTSAKFVTFAMCAFGADWQKETTLMYSAGLDAWLDSLHERSCEHSHHSKLAGGLKSDGNWNSNKTAAYPPDLNLFLAQAMADYIRQRQPDPALSAPPSDNALSSPGPVAATRLDAGSVSPDDDSQTDSPAIAPEEALPNPAVVNASSPFRQPRFDEDDHSGLEHIHEEPEPEELPDLNDRPPPAEKAPRRKVTFEKTAGARGTRSNQPALLPGIGNSAGFAGMALLSLGATLTNALDAMCTKNLLEELSQPHSNLSVALAKPSTIDPKTQAEAYSRDRAGWRESEAKELQNHHDNGSWEYIDADQLPRGRRLVKLVWVYKVKRNGSLKSRLCVQGCRQVPGVDYDQTWCGAMRSTSLRLLSNLAANGNMRMRRYDFVAAYLQGELLEGETVYCYPPPGYERKGKDGRNQICRILKPVYGMAQAGRRWQRTLFPWLLEYGFTQTHSDQSVFTLERTVQAPSGPRVDRLHVGVYVDDLAIVYGHDDECSLYRSFVTALEARWKVEDEGELTDLLGIEFTRSENTMELRQTKYIEKLAAEHFPDGVPATAQLNKVPCDRDLPATVHIALVNDAKPEADLLRQYQSLCGGLLYASTNTRPDIAFATGMLCRAMGRPTPELLERAKRVLGYLYRTRHIGLRYEGTTPALEGFSDSDWGVKHSTSGHVFRLGSATISWASKKQPTVALSSCEAEIMAGSEAAKEAIYLSSFLNELGLPSSQPPPLYMDNKSAIDLAYNPEHHARTKHIERRHYFVRECVEHGRLRVPFVSTADNIADFFTKPLMGKEFFRMRDIIMNVPHGSSHRPSPS